MATKLEKVLAVSKDLFLLENQEQEIKSKIAAARKQLASLVKESGKVTAKRRTHVRVVPIPEEKATGFDPALGDYGAKGGYGQRGKTGEILAYMRTIPDRMMAPEDVVRELKWPGDKETNCQIASRLLQRLAQARKLVRPHRGLYQFNLEKKA